MKPKPPDDTVHTLVQLFAELAEAQGISLGTLAKAAGVGERTLYRWRMGDTVPSIDDLERVFKVLGHKLAIVKENTP